MVFTDHQILSYFIEENTPNRRQARWVHILPDYPFGIIYCDGLSNQMADILSQCPVYISREGGTTPVIDRPLLGPVQWLEIGDMEIYDESLKYIDITALDTALLSSEQTKVIKQDAMLDNQY